MTNFLFFTTPTSETIYTNPESIMFTVIVILLSVLISVKIVLDLKRK